MIFHSEKNITYNIFFPLKTKEFFIYKKKNLGENLVITPKNPFLMLIMSSVVKKSGVLCCGAATEKPEGICTLHSAAGTACWLEWGSC